MAAAWTAEQVLALAPDPASAKAGRDLSATRKWVRLGAGEDVIWGECQGSGSSPYQTKVDLGEPAYHCSCPSRKFPCKHALGLFLIWTGQQSSFTKGDPPPWVASWLEARSTRAEKKAAKEKEKQEKAEKGEPAVDPAAQKKREAARLAKVEAGLEDLGVWIGDLVRHGLATVQGKPGGFWEEQARRMVDAQAPGVARRLRLIEGLPLSGDGWQGALLEHLARLHLVVEGRRRLEALPDETQADLRMVIGFPTDLDQVRSGAGVRDAWQVIGQRVEIEDRLRAYRTWLIGKDSGRPALVLDFAHASQPIADLLPPGIVVDADLAFFPGSVPLRALVQRRHAPAETLGPPSGHPTIAAAYSAFAEALGRNPWLELYPLVLDEVRLQFGQDTWSIRDARGGVLPVSARFSKGWQLLGVNGGHPMVLAGEFDGTSIEPLAFWVDGRFRAFSSGECGPSPTGSAALDSPEELAMLWRETSAAALVGAERKAPPSLAAMAPLVQTLGDVAEADAPSRLLTTAAALAWYGRVGRRPAIETVPLPEPCNLEDIADCGEAPAARLRRLLDGEHAEFLPEWLGLIASKVQRIPGALLADVLTLARGRSELRPAVREALGGRGRWLASRNPDWGFVGGGADLADPESVWQTGTRPERLVALRRLRDAEPARALALLGTTWSKESAEDRTAFVEVLEAGIGMPDEPFLESALDDRSKAVRRAAATLLAKVPESRFCRRMIERASPLLRSDGQAVHANPPAKYDPAWARDGIEEDVPGGHGKRMWWLRQIVGATPPRTWCLDASSTPARLAWSIRGGDDHEDLWLAWASATVHARDAEWAIALLLTTPKRELATSQYRAPLLDLLSREDRDAFLRDRLDSDPGPLRPEHPAFDLLNAGNHPIGQDVGREVLRKVRKLVDAEYEEARGKPEEEAYQLVSGASHVSQNRDYATYGLIAGLARTLPHELAEEAGRGLPDVAPAGLYYGAAYQQFLQAIRFRHEMHEEFAR